MLIISDQNIKSFEKYAKQYGIDFALKKVDTEIEGKTKFLVFFKAKDQDAIMSAFQEYSLDKIKQAQNPKPSIKETIRQKQKLIQETMEKTPLKIKKKEQSR